MYSNAFKSFIKVYAVSTAPAAGGGLLQLQLWHPPT